MAAWVGIWASQISPPATGRREYLEELAHPLNRRVLGMGVGRLRSLLDDSYALLRSYEAGDSTEQEVVDVLYERLGQVDWVPPGFDLV